MLKIGQKVITYENSQYKCNGVNIAEENISNFKFFENNEIVTKLGIQAPPGCIFQVNTNDNAGNIAIGLYGVYEIDLSGGLGTIQSLSTNVAQLTTLEQTNAFTQINKIIVDYVYETTTTGGV